MKPKFFYLNNFISFALGIIFFMLLINKDFFNQNPIKLYLFSYECLLNVFFLVSKKTILTILLIIPMLTFIFLIISLKTNNKIIKILTCIFLFLFNLNQYLILENLIYI